MNQWFRIFISQILILSVFFLPSAYSFGANSESSSISDQSFNGSWNLQSDGRLQLSMADGSLIFIGPGGQVDPQTIGQTNKLSLRRDQTGRVIFAADSQLILIYTFRYKRDNSWVMMTDPEDMVSGFKLDPTTGKITGILLPSGKRLSFP
jgi:hypothetical protein